MSELYDATYYKCHCGPDPYERTTPWLNFFGNVADQLLRSIAPRKVFDAGCAWGFLVEAFWDRGVEAYGIDVSSYAIAQVRRDIAPYCRVGSLADPIEGRYDLVTCIEVLEHIAPDEAAIALANIVSLSDTILFSSSPTDLTEETHFNVHPTISWLKQFAKHGFYPDLTFDATFLTPHAILFRKSEKVSDDVLILFSERIRYQLAYTKAHGDAFRAEARLAEMSRVNAANETRAADLQARIDDAQQRLLRLEGEQEAAKAVATDAIAALRTYPAELQLLLSHGDQRALFQKMEASIAATKAQYDMVVNSTTWRVSEPVRKMLERLSPQHRKLLRRGAKAAWWMVTPWRIPERLRIRREIIAASQSIPPTLAPPTPGIVLPPQHATVPIAPMKTAYGVLESRFPNLQAVPVCRIAPAARRVVMVTDSINAGSLYGGIGTALILCSLLAERLKATLVIATRTEAPQKQNFSRLLKIQNISLSQSVEFVHAGPGGEQLDIGADDIVVTTSWWTTHATKRAVPRSQILYLIQEDERMFYPLGDDHLLCSEVISDPDIRYIVNSRLLFEHFGSSGLDVICQNGSCFEPAFPSSNYFWEERQTKRKFEFMFYARPHNVRNLYYRGLAVIERAIAEGVIDPEEWNINFVGKDLEPIVLGGTVAPRLFQNMEWDQYAALIRSTDLALSLMYTPHPSYPPLDVAASGGVVVTNAFANKRDLSEYSANILTADLEVDALLETLRKGVALAKDVRQRRMNYDAQKMLRDWETALEPTISDIAKHISSC